MSSAAAQAEAQAEAQGRPNVARMYDYFLGGCHNFAPDRAAADRVLEILPETRVAAQANRHFLHRAVRHAAQRGIRQFLDIGAGLPTQGNVHEIVRAVDPGARVVYVDNDEVAVAYAGELLTETDGVVVVRGDLRRPDELLAHPAVRATLDLTAPVAVLLAAVLHFVPDTDDPYGAVAGLRDACAPGSHLVLSHLTVDDVPPDMVQQGEAIYRSSSAPLVPRTHADTLRFFTGYDLVEPGLVWLADWRPDHGAHPVVSHSYGAVGIRR
ncbi:SAM-dependent methyltransferase [Micromonospora yangpuensis]|uniref:SAM-dependent methyltransferase n=1 Tax=Micromonospora yangpuensis TaxID=683228 RepID=UPI00227B51B4|nr:SAM-dependent methyltransferase [Micromonospora yangpuensis]